MNDQALLKNRIEKLVHIAKAQLKSNQYSNAQETVERIQRLIRWRKELLIQRNAKQLKEFEKSFGKLGSQMKETIERMEHLTDSFKYLSKTIN